MNKKILKEILKTESVSFSYEEIQQILDEELEKSPDEMDTQLVDLCVDALNKQETTEKKEVKTHKKISPKKLLLVAAVICILAILAIPVTAQIPAIESQGGVIKVLESYISINLTGGKEYNLSTELQSYNIPENLLPARFFENDCVVSDVQFLNGNSYRFDFDLTDSDIDGYISIVKYADEWAFENNYADVYADAEQLEQLTVNGIEIFVYSSVDGTVVVKYLSEEFSVNIFFNNLTVHKVIEIIKNF